MSELTTAKFYKDIAYKKQRQQKAIMQLAKYKGNKYDTFVNSYIIGMLKTGATITDTIELGASVLKYHPYFEGSDPQEFVEAKMEAILKSGMCRINPDPDFDYVDYITR